MHQYHLGQDEEEKEGELVVSKIFYQTQPRQCNWSSERSPTTGEGSEASGTRESGSNTSSCKEVMINHDNRDYQMCISAASLSSFTDLDMQHLRASGDEQFSFVPFGRKPFDEVIKFYFSPYFLSFIICLFLFLFLNTCLFLFCI